MTTSDRPRPLRDVAQDVSITVGLTGGLVAALAGYGILTAVQANALTGLLGAVPGVVTAITAVVASFTTATRGEQHVTPLSSPVDVDGNVLAPLHGRHEQP